MIWRNRFTRRYFSWMFVVSISLTWVLALAPHADAGIFDTLFRRRNAGRAGQGTSEGASVRDDACTVPIGNHPLMALAPSDEVGSTTLDHPTFLFYVPFARSQQIAYAEFMLLNEQQDYAIDRPIRVALPETAGLVRFTLPNPTLEANQKYNWYFSIVCDAAQPSRNPVISGWIQHTVISPTLEAKLQTLPQELRYRAYEAEDIWYDTLATLAEYSNDPSLQPLWSSVLEAYGLEDTAQQSIPELVPITSP